MELFILIIYLISLLFIFLFSLGQLHLAVSYRRKKISHDHPNNWKGDLPVVTIQLPLYNERYVAGRLIDCVCEMDYPAEKLEIQVLDDSTDDTGDIIAQHIGVWKSKGIDIRHIRRIGREGFKAGALDHGLNLARGQFIAIFDADFLPEKDFLQRSIREFDENTGMVQSRWGHVNQQYSLLTRLQAFGLDAHFTVEQSGRSQAGSFINFNGTAGVWRKTCIVDAGGWSADTLTEDLDLSYRAQLKGWKFKYLEDSIAPAELPVIMPAVKSQQYRWNKGAAETARKNLMTVLRSDLKFSTKFHAFFHLLNSSVFVSLLIAGLLSVPVLFIKQAHPEWNLLFYMGTVFLIGFFSIGYFYWTAVRAVTTRARISYFLRYFPLFLVVSMGLSFHNGMAVIEGLAGRKTPFLRTPKFNVINSSDSWKTNRYIQGAMNIRTFIEGILTLYFLMAFVQGIISNETGFLIFHGMLAIGFGYVFISSLTSSHASRSQS